jgi:hypothetical protein
MKAVRFSRFEGPEVLEIADLPDPHPGPSQVRIAVRAAGVNPSDWKKRKGLMNGELPQTMGHEAAGVVDELGEGVGDVAVGDRVFGFSVEGAAQAELTVLSYYAPIPPSLDFADAAALPAAIETATRALDQLGVGERQHAAHRRCLRKRWQRRGSVRRRTRRTRNRNRQSGKPRVPSLAGGRARRLRRGPRRAGPRGSCARRDRRADRVRTYLTPGGADLPARRGCRGAPGERAGAHAREAGAAGQLRQCRRECGRRTTRPTVGKRARPPLIHPLPQLPVSARGNWFCVEPGPVGR